MNVFPVLERPQEFLTHFTKSSKRVTSQIPASPQLIKQAQKAGKTTASIKKMTHKDLIRISLEKFKLNKNRKENNDGRSFSETFELYEPGLLSDRTKISTRRPISPVKCNTTRNKKSQILFNQALNGFFAQPLSQTELSLVAEKIKMKTEDVPPIKQSRILNGGNEFIQSHILSSRLLASQPPKPMNTHKKAKSISGIKILQKKVPSIPSIPKLKIVCLQNFNDYYSTSRNKQAGMDNTNRTVTKQPSLDGNLNQISLTDRFMDDPNKASFYLNVLHDQKAEFMSLTAREPSLQSPNSFYIGQVAQLDFKKPCLTVSKTANMENEPFGVNIKKSAKKSVKPGFVEYIKKNLDFDRYFKTLERNPKPITQQLLPRERTIGTQSNIRSGKSKVFDTKRPRENQPAKSINELIVSQTPDSKLNKSSYALISEVQFIPNRCPLSVLHQYPAVIKTPYVYEYSAHVHYNSYWLDRIIQLCENPHPLNDVDVGYYSLREIAQNDYDGLPEELDLLLRFIENVASDIKFEHQSTTKLNNSLLLKSQFV